MQDLYLFKYIHEICEITDKYLVTNSYDRPYYQLRGITPNCYLETLQHSSNERAKLL